MAKTKKPDLKKIRATLEEVLEATQTHFDEICGEDNERLQDVIDGMDISIQKLETVIKELKP